MQSINPSYGGSMISVLLGLIFTVFASSVVKMSTQSAKKSYLAFAARSQFDNFKFAATEALFLDSTCEMSSLIGLDFATYPSPKRTFALTDLKIGNVVIASTDPTKQKTVHPALELSEISVEQYSYPVGKGEGRTAMLRFNITGQPAGYVKPVFRFRFPLVVTLDSNNKVRSCYRRYSHRLTCESMGYTYAPNGGKKCV